MSSLDMSMGETVCPGDSVLWTLLDTALNTEEKTQHIGNYLVIGADVNHVNRSEPELSGMFPLLLATAIGNEQLVQYLLDEGADVNQEVGYELVQQHAIPTALHQACTDGHLDIVEILTSRKELACLEVKDCLGKTAFHSAIESGEVDIVRRLIQEGCDVHTMDRDGNNGLFSAISLTGQKLKNMFSFLLAKGLCPFEHNNKGLTPLKYAALLGKFEAVDLVSEINDRSCVNNHSTSKASLGLSDLESIIIFKKWTKLSVDELKRVAMLCLSKKTDKSLHFAVQYGDKTLVRFLLQNGGLDKISSHTAFGMTPLLMACDMKSTDIVKILLEYGAKADQASNFDRGLTPLKKSVLHGDIEMAADLLKHGADIQSGANKHLLNRALYSRDVAMWTLLLAAGATTASLSQYLMPVSFNIHENFNLIHCLYTAGHYTALYKFAKSLPRDQQGIFYSQSVPENFNAMLRHEIYSLIFNAPTLQDVCKNKIRKKLKGKVLNRTDKLGLPASIQSFIMLDVFHIIQI